MAIEALSLDAVQGFAASAISGIIGIGAWLGSKLYSLMRHETRDMKQSIVSQQETLQRHLESDERIHRELTGSMMKMEGYLGTIARRFGHDDSNG